MTEASVKAALIDFRLLYTGLAVSLVGSGLWLVAIAIISVIVLGFVWRLAGDRLLKAALVPGGAFEAAAAGKLSRPALTETSVCV